MWEIFDIAAETAFFPSRHALSDWLNANPALGLQWVAFLQTSPPSSPPGSPSDEPPAPPAGRVVVVVGGALGDAPARQGTLFLFRASMGLSELGRSASRL